MDDIVNSISGIIPPKYQFLIGASLILGRIIQAIRNGGGLKSIIASVWLGTNTPKVKPPTDQGNSIAGPLTLLLIASLAIMPLGGCVKGTTPAKAIVNISDTSKITADSALRVWDAWIVAHHPPLEQQAAVRKAWKKYKSAQLLVLDAALVVKVSSTQGTDPAEADAKLNSAIAEAGNALADLLNLLRTFGVKL